MLEIEKKKREEEEEEKSGGIGKKTNALFN